jgi:hypothetical protein
MVKIIEIKKEKPVEKEEEKKEIDEKEEPKKESEMKRSSFIVEKTPLSDWEDVLAKKINPTLDRRIVSTTQGVIPRTNLENSLEDVPTEQTEEKKPESYSTDQSSYMGKGGVLGEATGTRRVEEFMKDPTVKTIGNWNPQFENSAQPKMYEIKRNADETLKTLHETEAFRKYSTRR